MRRLHWVAAVASAVMLFACDEALRAQCVPSPGIYEMSISVPADNVCAGVPVTVEVHASPAGPPVSGFGFNLVFGNPGTVLSVTPGYPLGGISVFLSNVGAGGDTVAALGIHDSPLTLLATIVFQPAAIPLPAQWGVGYGGTLPLESGIVPQDHLVEAATGCDVTPATGLSLINDSFAVSDCFVRGDCNNNGLVAGYMGDIWFLLNFLFLAGPAPACEMACDSNDDDQIELNDAILLLNWLIGGPAPPPPAPLLAGPFLGDCGLDPDPLLSTLSCTAGICP